MVVGATRVLELDSRISRKTGNGLQGGWAAGLCREPRALCSAKANDLKQKRGREKKFSALDSPIEIFVRDEFWRYASRGTSKERVEPAALAQSYYWPGGSSQHVTLTSASEPQHKSHPFSFAVKPVMVDAVLQAW